MGFSCRENCRTPFFFCFFELGNLLRGNDSFHPLHNFDPMSLARIEITHHHYRLRMPQ